VMANFENNQPGPYSLEHVGYGDNRNMTANAKQLAEQEEASYDLELVHATKNGDVAAFEQLVKRHERKLLRIAQGVTHNTEDSQDVVQEAFLKAFQNLSQFREESRFSTWLIRITVNQSLMRLRKQRSTKEASLDHDCRTDADTFPVEIADWAPNPEQLYWASELRDILRNALSEMRPILRTVFVVRDMEGLSIDQTAEVLNLSQAAVKARLWRARMHLRECLTKYFRKTADATQAELVPLGRRAGRVLGLVAECLRHSIPQADSITANKSSHSSL
jgi:RNA polymerase sigma-70 factor (ECF subfamily)